MANPSTRPARLRALRTSTNTRSARPRALPDDHPLVSGETLLPLLDAELSNGAIPPDAIRGIEGAFAMAERFLVRADVRLRSHENRRRLRAAEKRLRSLRKRFAEKKGARS